MTVLARVPRELVTGQLAAAPALVEGMLQDVPPLPGGVDSLDEAQGVSFVEGLTAMLTG